MSAVLRLGIDLVERGWIPDPITRHFMRRLCADRLRDPLQTTDPDRVLSRERFLKSLYTGPIAPVPELANQQHYELPAEFFETVLGPHRKYSCCLYADDQATLAQAEVASLEQTCERAELCNGQQVLELGCGWGSLSLWMAEHDPDSIITAVSNSSSQKMFIEAEAHRRNLKNLRVITADMNGFSPPYQSYDRIISVEMFEHMRNYAALLQRIAGWLRSDGKLFVHIFCHRELIYPFETGGSANWMGKYFFTGGVMPSADLLTWFPQSLRVSRQWTWGGQHYQRTAEDWLANLDAHHHEVLRILSSVYGCREAPRWLQRWRIFFLAVSELFGYADGKEWFVTHYLLEHAAVSGALQDRSCPHLM